MKATHAGTQSFRRMLCISVAVAGLAVGGALTACGSSHGLQAGHTPAVLHLGAVQQGRNTTAAGAPDSKMMPMRPVEYVFDGTMPNLGTSASAYSVGGKVATAAFVEQVAKAFGLTGAAVAQPSDQGGGWRVGAADYTTPVVMAGQWGMQQWSYSSPAAATAGVSCTVAGSTDGTVPVPPDAPKCAEPAPIADLPTEAAAIAEAKRLLGAMGLDAASYQFTSYPSAWNISVNGSLAVDGMATDLNVSFTFGAKAEVQYAGGALGAVALLDAYPIVSVADGVKRLGDPSGPWYAFGGPMVMARTAVAVDVAGGTPNIGEAPTIPVPSGGSDVAPPSAVTAVPAPTAVPPVSIPIGTMPADTVPVDTTPYVVHLTGVKLVLSSVFQADGSQILLPAFAFTTSDGSEYRVLAVDAAFLDTSSTTASSVPSGTGVTGSAGSGSSGSSGASTGSIAVPTPGIGTIVLATFDEAKQLAGLPLDKAKALAAEKGWELRVAEEDGTTNSLTADMRPNRVNVIVKAGVVFDIMSVG